MGNEVVETRFEPETLRYKEALFTIGNGYVGTRGTFDEGYPGTQPVTLIHGLYDDVPIVHTELVNAPNWLALTVLADGERFSLARGEVLDYRRTLDLRTGTLRRRVRWRSPQGTVLDLTFERFASMADRHVLGARYTITAVDFAGTLEVRSGLFGFTDNDGVMHWEHVDQGYIGSDRAYLRMRTRATGIELCQATTLRASTTGAVQLSALDCDGAPTLAVTALLARGQTIMVDKLVTLYRDADAEEPCEAALATLDRAAAVGYDAVKAANDSAWAEIWARCDVQIEGDDEADLAVRYSLFQLLIAAPRPPLHASIPAKTLSGFGYRGHIFWDTEIFMLPFFIYTQPEIARNMLLYRYHCLGGARRKAAQQGYEGAMYAWESAATGDETTPRWVPLWVADRGPGELVRIWCGDIEVHISADVAYAVDQYWQATGDDAFMRDYGAEIVLDTACFWGSFATWNPDRGVYEIKDVIGPDENHDHVDNNAYTNGLARWNLRRALEVWQWLLAHDPTHARALEAKLDLSAARLAHWAEVAERLVLNIDSETGLIEQFDGFYDLREVDLEAYEPRQTSMQALLGIEETQRCQILKQPDVLMLLYLLPEAFDEATLRANYAYYTPRTDLTYGSSLGPAIQAALAARMGDLAAAAAAFDLAARTDLHNARTNTGEGIHGATAGGIWQAVIFGFGGIRLTAAGLTATPRLPQGWTRLRFRLHYRGQVHDFDLRP